MLESSSAQITSTKAKHSRYDLNWCNINDYVSNWSILTMDEKESLRSILHSDLEGNCYRFGLKKKNLETHLLLSLGADLGNIINKGDYISTLLKTVGGRYSALCTNNRTLDPKTCSRAYHRFLKSYDMAKLFSNGGECYQAVVSPKEPSIISCALSSKPEFKKTFEENNKFFSDLTLKSKKVAAYLCSHEISVDSILDQKYRPHSHFMVFLTKHSSKEHNSVLLKTLEEKFNLKYPDRNLQFLRKETGEILKASTYPAIEKSIQYLFRSYSLADQYLREIYPDNIRELNKKTVETFHTLIHLFKSEESNSTKGIKRICSGKLPKLLKIAKKERVK